MCELGYYSFQQKEKEKRDRYEHEKKVEKNLKDNLKEFYAIKPSVERGDLIIQLLELLEKGE